MKCDLCNGDATIKAVLNKDHVALCDKCFNKKYSYHGREVLTCASCGGLLGDEFYISIDFKPVCSRDCLIKVCGFKKMSEDNIIYRPLGGERST